MQQQAEARAPLGTMRWYEEASSDEIAARLKRLTFTLPAALILLVLLVAVVLLEPVVQGLPAVVIAFALSALWLPLLSSSALTIVEVLQGRLRQQNDALHAKSEEAAILKERDRIGMELHDGAIQSLYGVGLKLDSCLDRVEAEPGQVRQDIDGAIEDLNEIIRDIRSYIFDLRPEQREGRSLRDSLDELLRELSVNTLIATHLTVADGKDADDPTEALSNEQRERLFLIAQETLANVRKYSQARSVQMEIGVRDGRFQIRFRHDGSGREGNWETVREEARSLGGHLKIEDRARDGTSISVEFPLQTRR
jgi:signal transduction histidine kinase